jgi:hypothetical protein
MYKQHHFFHRAHKMNTPILSVKTKSLLYIFIDKADEQSHTKNRFSRAIRDDEVSILIDVLYWMEKCMDSLKKRPEDFEKWNPVYEELRDRLDEATQ